MPNELTSLKCPLKGKAFVTLLIMIVMETITKIDHLVLFKRGEYHSEADNWFRQLRSAAPTVKNLK